MAKFAKWIGGTLGWALGGPVGAILGFAFGSAFDNVDISEVKNSTKTRPGNTTQGDFVVSLLILSAAVMKADGKTLRSELDFVKRFLIQQFGEQQAAKYIPLLKDVLNKDIPLREVCAQIKHYMPQAARLQLIHYLFGISQADGHVHHKEVEVIENIASYLGISRPDYNSIMAMYFRDVESDYRILEIKADATDEEVKKAYRKMAVKYHPDKVAGLGEQIENAAKEKFQKLQDAYESIKEQRGM